MVTASDREAVCARVAAEAARFRTAVPRLLAEYGGQWVVFRDGTVVSVHSDEESVYLAGLERFGPAGGHVVAVVREPQVVMLRPAITFF